MLPSNLVRTGGGLARNDHEGSVRSRRSACAHSCVGLVGIAQGTGTAALGVVLALQALVFGSAAAGFEATDHRTLALAFGVIVVINAILMYVWWQ